MKSMEMRWKDQKEKEQEGIQLTGDKGDWDKAIRKWEWTHEWRREKWQNKRELKHAHTYNIPTLEQRHSLFSFLQNIFFHPERATETF